MRKLDLINQVSQYNQIAQYSSGTQATQYQNLAQQAQAQLQTVESDPVDATTLKQMVDDQVVLDNLHDLGLTITNAQLDEFQAQQFSPAPIGSPTPTLPVDPTAAAWATETAQAQASAASCNIFRRRHANRLGDTIKWNAFRDLECGVDDERNGNESQHGGNPECGDEWHTTGSPTAGTPTAGSPTAASPTPTLTTAQASATAASNFNQYNTLVLKKAGMSQSDFRRLVLKPDYARQKVSQKLESEVPTRATQIHAEHILVATQEAANQIVNTTLKTKSFEEVAKTESTDTSTAPNGGDLGWIPEGIMTPEFDKVAFSLKVGEVSKPFQTKYGWEIVKVLDRQDNRPITTEMLSQLRNNKMNDWLDQKRAAAKIDWNIGAAMPSPTPQTQFVAPPDAPPTPTPLPTPTPTPAPPGTPGAGTPSAATPTP